MVESGKKITQRYTTERSWLHVRNHVRRQVSSRRVLAQEITSAAVTGIAGGLTYLATESTAPTWIAAIPSAIGAAAAIGTVIFDRRRKNTSHAERIISKLR